LNRNLLDIEILLHNRFIKAGLYLINE